jgi:hypothetical protein
LTEKPTLDAEFLLYLSMEVVFKAAAVIAHQDTKPADNAASYPGI